ncbi:MAG TPA: isochorismate synthase [Candidatus Limnocylindrales bacterium]|nr:isochorismate synthase [Candidatus Limnocylindrales bacterium]
MISRPLRIRRELLAETATRDPLDAIELAPGEPAFYWRSDERDVEIAALGAVAVVESSGRTRFRDAIAQLESLRATIDDVDGDWPLAVGGFAFDDAAPGPTWTGFPPLRLFVPRMLWVRRGAVTRMIVAYAAGRAQTPASLLACNGVSPCDGRSTSFAAADEPASDWHRRVSSAVDAIRAGEIEKVVLARRHTARCRAPIALLVRALAEARPSCFTFLVRWNGRAFAGSSPERLLRLDQGRIDADALAGSAGRGHSAAHDEALARELLASPKDQREHRIVSDAIRDALAPFACEIDVPEQPVVQRLPEAHHLHTPIRARLAPGKTSHLLSIAERLHPTPAVCGAPREDACRRLAAEEPDRGWYGGGIGWIGASGDGELAVALRAALIDADAAHVWAGAGIVEGSSPEREFDETERKMASILPYFERGTNECAA